jgi:hypothetical protein
MLTSYIAFLCLVILLIPPQRSAGANVRIYEESHSIVSDTYRVSSFLFLHSYL